VAGETSAGARTRRQRDDGDRGSPWWTLSQTLVWIAWRNEARAQASATAHTLNVIIEAAEAERLVVEHPNGVPDLDLPTADLRAALARGQVRSTKIEAGTGAVTSIPVEAWADPIDPLVLCVEDKRPFACCATWRFHTDFDHAPWRDPRFHRDDVRRVWPAHVLSPTHLSARGNIERSDKKHRREQKLIEFEREIRSHAVRERKDWALRGDPLPLTREEFAQGFSRAHPDLAITPSTFASNYRHLKIRFAPGRRRAHHRPDRQRARR